MDHVSNRLDTLRESYLEVVEGQAFAIQYRIVRSGQSSLAEVEVQVKLDGRPICGCSLQKHDPPDGEISTMCIEQDGKRMEADLAFATMPKTDDESEVQISGRAVDVLCSIEVALQQGTFGPADDKDPPITEARIGLVHEKQLKIGSTIQPTNMRPVTEIELQTFTPALSDPHICRFIWKYHTRASLDIMGITEAQVTPSAARTARSIVSVHGTARLRRAKREPGLDEEGDDIVITDAKRIKSEGRIMNHVKREKSGMGSRATPIMVSDADITVRRKRASGTRAEAIDLTLD